MSELKPCPFCGRKPSKVHEYQTGVFEPVFYVSCKASRSKCLVKPSTSMYKTDKEAVEAWNKRAGE